MIRVATDSTANIPQEIMAEQGIAMVPTYVHFGSETLLDVVQISTAEFYKRLVSAKELPTTSQLSVNDFVDFYGKIAAESPGATILSLHVSGALSGTIESARQAAAQLPDLKIFIFDTRSISMGHGLMVTHAARMARDGTSMDDILTRLGDMRKRMRVYWVLDTLDYLAKSGRIGRAARFMGTLLDMKPILTLKDGMIDAYDRQRGRSRALSALVDLVVKDAAGKSGLQLAVVHAACEDDGKALAEELKGKVSPEVQMLGEIGPSVGVYVGPGTLGACWWWPEDKTQ